MPLAKDILGKLRESYDGRAWCRRYLEVCTHERLLMDSFPVFVHGRRYT